mgnify:CR=1 FL=1
MIPKFRAWKKINTQEMLNDVRAIDFDKRMIKIGYPLSRDTTRIDTESLDNVKLMQSTGLKDILGNDIYEGDIVKVLVENDEPKIMSGKMYVGVVAYNQGVFDIRTFKDTYLGIIPQVYLSDVNCAFRVLGNIYENPELLEDN